MLWSACGPGYYRPLARVRSNCSHFRFICSLSQLMSAKPLSLLSAFLYWLHTAFESPARINLNCFRRKQLTIEARLV